MPPHTESYFCVEYALHEKITRHDTFAVQAAPPSAQDQLERFRPQHQFQTLCEPSCRKPIKIRQHDPYCVAHVAPKPQASLPFAPRGPTLPAGTLHESMLGYVSFVPYPTSHRISPRQQQLEREPACRLFVGQLPYGITDAQLDWLFLAFGGASLHAVQRITKASADGRIPTGCVHGYCSLDRRDALINQMHKRLLFDDTGVWYGRTPQEMDNLSSYCYAMIEDRTRRFPHRPFDTMVVQVATSTFTRGW